MLATSRGGLTAVFRLLSTAILATAFFPGCEPPLPDYTDGAGIGLSGYKKDGHDNGGGGGGGNGVDRSDDPCGEDMDGTAASGLVISEVLYGPGGFVELHSGFDEPINLAAYVLHGDLQLQLPDLVLEPGEKHLVSTSKLTGNGELGLLFDGFLVDYLCWGASHDGELHHEASLTELWFSPGSCALQPALGRSLHLRGAGQFAGDYIGAPPSPLGCSE